MSILRTEQHSTESTKESGRIRKALVHELERLVKLAKERNISLASLPTSITKLELMILDSAFKGLPLEKADQTLLILPSRYEEMLQKLIVALVLMIQN